jgi:hypothetical protein
VEELGQMVSRYEEDEERPPWVGEGQILEDQDQVPRVLVGEGEGEGKGGTRKPWRDPDASNPDSSAVVESISTDMLFRRTLMLAASFCWVDKGLWQTCPLLSSPQRLQCCGLSESSILLIASLTFGSWMRDRLPHGLQQRVVVPSSPASSPRA